MSTVHAYADAADFLWGLFLIAFMVSSLLWVLLDRVTTAARRVRVRRARRRYTLEALADARRTIAEAEQAWIELSPSDVIAGRNLPPHPPVLEDEVKRIHREALLHAVPLTGPDAPRRRVGRFGGER